MPSGYEAHSTSLLSLSQLPDSRKSPSQAWSLGPEVLLLWLCVASVFIWGQPEVPFLFSLVTLAGLLTSIHSTI